MSELRSQRARVLYVEPAPSRLSSVPALEGRFELVTRSDAAAALALLEEDDDFAVVIAEISSRRPEELDFLRRVRELSPTTTRVALASPSTKPELWAPDLVFHSLPVGCGREALLRVVTDAVRYHRLVARSPLQPVPGGPHERSSAVAAGDAQVTVRLGLRIPGRTIELLPGITILGRSRSCHVLVEDPRVSRRHACFSCEGGQLYVRNISSTSKLLVNGARLERDAHQRLELGDRLEIGSQQIEICGLNDYHPSLEPTERFAEDALEPTDPEQNATLATLAVVAEKYVRLGHQREAERILRPLLDGLLRYCRAGGSATAADVKLAVDVALGFAEANRGAEWIEYVFELHLALREPARLSVVEWLYRIIPDVPGIRMGSYRAYVEVLEALDVQFGPAQRFLVRRIHGLESRLMMSAHV